MSWATPRQLSAKAAASKLPPALKDQPPLPLPVQGGEAPFLPSQWSSRSFLAGPPNAWLLSLSNKLPLRHMGGVWPHCTSTQASSLPRVCTCAVPACTAVFSCQKLVYHPGPYLPFCFPRLPISYPYHPGCPGPLRLLACAPPVPEGPAHWAGTAHSVTPTALSLRRPGAGPPVQLPAFLGLFCIEANARIAADQPASNAGSGTQAGPSPAPGL